MGPFSWGHVCVQFPDVLNSEPRLKVMTAYSYCQTVSGRCFLLMLGRLRSQTVFLCVSYHQPQAGQRHQELQL